MGDTLSTWFGWKGAHSMPWRELSIMDQREEFVRLALAPGANRSELCRRFGISRDKGYKWLKRYRGEGRVLPIARGDRMPARVRAMRRRKRRCFASGRGATMHGVAVRSPR